MGRIARNLTELVGNTPLLILENYSRHHGLKAEIIAKLEYFNPAGSVKDRVALAMIEAAEKSGALKKGATIVEPTSGNTGVGLAFVGAAKGYRVILTMPDTMSQERRNILKALGAEVVLTPGAQGMKGAIAKAQEILENTESAFMPQQFENAANPEIHKKTTAQEILRDAEGKVDIFVSGVGTGGTLTGVGSALKQANPDTEVVAVEPKDSAVLSGNSPGPHKIQGIGAGFIPKIYDESVADEIMTVDAEEAFEAARQAAKLEGLLIGISSGAALFAARNLATREENSGKRIVVLLPDSGERYLSTELYV